MSDPDVLEVISGIVSRRSARISAIAGLALAASLATDSAAISAAPDSASMTTTMAVSHTAPRARVAAAPSYRERYLVYRINQERIRRGMAPYTYSPSLSKVAKRWTGSMIRSQKLAHNPRLTRQVTNFRWVGENVGYGPNLDTLHAAFMASPGHKANVLDHDYTQVGVAVVKDANGRTWVAEVFRQPRR